MRGMATGVAMALALVACGGDSKSVGGADLGVETAKLSPLVDNPFVAFADVRRAVYEGEEIDADTGESIEVRVEASVRNTTTEVAGIEVTVVDVADFEDGELVEKTQDFYAQHESGDVYYVGENVDDYEGGQIVGHGGEWLAGRDGARAGVFMPADPAVGDEFDQERAPGVAEDRSKVVKVGLRITVPAGTFDDCIQTEDFAPIEKTTQSKFYCRGVGLVREAFLDGSTIDLIKFEPV